MKTVIIESPFRGADLKERTRNQTYLRRCIRDSIFRGESPYASHLMLPGALDEDDPIERKMGIEAGYAWWPKADLIVFYTDLDWSQGMILARARCHQPQALRNLGYKQIADLL